MKEGAIRHAVDTRVRATLQHANDEPVAVRHELGVHEGRRRIDVAAINGHLDGWEINSDADTLRRLQGQVAAFSRVLDRCTLVTTQRHLAHAAPLLPDWWGIWLAEPARPPRQRASTTSITRTASSRTDAASSDGAPAQVRLVQVRRPRMSPVLDAPAIAQLLWRDEALAALRRTGHARGLSGRARHYVWERLVETTTLNELRALVRETLTARRDWPTGRPPA